jgi:methionyl-tRNA formyltransferase
VAGVESGALGFVELEQAFTHANVRLWKYPHERDDELLVPRFAAEHGLPVFTGRVKTPEFFEVFLDDWRPQLCLMGTFGQKIPNLLIDYPALGFYNFHHSGDTWPSYAGPDPIAAMMRDGRKHLVLTIHRVTDVIDGGEFVARSHRVAIPEGINAIGMHRITWPQMGPFIRREAGAMLDRMNRLQVSASLLLQEEAVPYGNTSHWAWAESLAAWTFGCRTGAAQHGDPRRTLRAATLGAGGRVGAEQP